MFETRWAVLYTAFQFGLHHVPIERQNIIFITCTHFFFPCEAYSYDEGFLYLKHKQMDRGGEKKLFVINTRFWGLLGKPASSLPFPGGFELHRKSHLTQYYESHRYNNVLPLDVCSVPDKWSALLATWKVGGPGCVLKLVPWIIFCWVVEGWLCKNRWVIFHCWYL